MRNCIRSRNINVPNAARNGTGSARRTVRWSRLSIGVTGERKIGRTGCRRRAPCRSSDEPTTCAPDPLTVQSFTVSPFAENCYVVHDAGEAALIDPGTADAGERRLVLDYLD